MKRPNQAEGLVRPKVFVVGGSTGFSAMFINFGWTITRNIEEADLVQFTGGADVHPSLYGELEHPQAFCNKARDDMERDVFQMCLSAGIKMAGICRGGQLLNCLNGGSMWQHVNNHTRSHEIFHPDGGLICMATSTHHQMMIPGKNAEILAIANECTNRECMSGNKVEALTGTHDDIEVLYYDETKSLCFQPHPEFATLGGPLQRYYFSLISEKLGINSPAGLIDNGKTA